MYYRVPVDQQLNQVCFYLTQAEIVELQDLADFQGYSLSGFIREIVREFLASE